MTSSNSVFDSLPETGSEAVWCIGELAHAVREKRYSRAYALLHKIKRENLVLAEEEKAGVLVDGLRCSLRLFQMLYEQLVGDGGEPEPGRWGGYPARHNMRFGEADGSLLLLAAAFDRPEHIRYLIEKGAEADRSPSVQREQIVVVQPERDEDEIFFMGEGVSILECTPLAAAIACGSAAALGVLMEHGDGQWTQDPSACRAMALAPSANEQWNARHETCVNAVLSAADDPLARSDLGNVRLPLREIVDVCTPELFAQQVLTFHRNKEEAYTAIERLIQAGVWGRGAYQPLPKINAAAEKMKLLASEFPALCREKRVAGAFLAGLCCINATDEMYWDCCIELWGDTVDLTWAADEVFALPQKALRSLLLRLKGKRIVINADAFSGMLPSAATLKKLLRCAEVEPSCFPRGLSGLAHRFLYQPDPELLRDVDAVRYLRREPRNALKKELERIKNTAVRSMILLACGTHETAAVNKERLKDYEFKNEWDYGQWDCMEQKLKRNHMETIEDCLFMP